MEAVDNDDLDVGVGGDDLMKGSVSFRDEPHCVPALPSSLVDRNVMVGNRTVLRVGKLEHVSDLSIFCLECLRRLEDYALASMVVGHDNRFFLWCYGTIP